MKCARTARSATFTIVLLLGIVAATSIVSAQSARDVVSEEALRQQVAATPTLKSHLTSKARPLTSRAPAIESSLWKNSIILTDGEKFTIVPVGAILHLPTELRAHVVAQPQGDFTFWPSFLKRNTAWLTGKEVSLTLSRGNTREANALLKSLARDPHLVVATYKGGPITVLEPAPADTSATSTPR